MRIGSSVVAGGCVIYQLIVLTSPAAASCVPYRRHTLGHQLVRPLRGFHFIHSGKLVSTVAHSFGNFIEFQFGKKLKYFTNFFPITRRSTV